MTCWLAVQYITALALMDGAFGRYLEKLGAIKAIKAARVRAEISAYEDSKTAWDTLLQPCLLATDVLKRHHAYGSPIEAHLLDGDASRYVSSPETRDGLEALLLRTG